MQERYERSELATERFQVLPVRAPRPVSPVPRPGTAHWWATLAQPLASPPWPSCCCSRRQPDAPTTTGGVSAPRRSNRMAWHSIGARRVGRRRRCRPQIRSPTWRTPPSCLGPPRVEAA